MKRNVVIALFLAGFSQELLAYSQPDTVIIQLSNREEIVIVSSSGNEVQQLSRLDLNKMIQELDVQQSGKDTGTVIIMEDETGTRYTLDDDSNNDDKSSTMEEKIERLERELDRLSESLDESFEKQPQSKEEQVQFNKQKKKGTSSTFVMEFGLNNYLREGGSFPDATNELYAVNPVVSWYVALGSMNSTHIAGPLSLDWGANVSWYNFKFDNVRTRVLKSDAGVVFYEDPTMGFEAIKSKVVVPYVNAILVPMFVLGKRRSGDWSPFSYHENDGFRIGLGAYAGYRVGGRSKFVIKDNGNRIREKDRTNFYFNNWRYGARLQLGFKGVDLFANYDLNELFVENRGPRLNAFSFGIIL
jgi:hypothetical protein